MGKRFDPAEYEICQRRGHKPAVQTSIPAIHNPPEVCEFCGVRYYIKVERKLVELDIEYAGNQIGVGGIQPSKAFKNWKEAQDRAAGSS